MNTKRSAVAWQGPLTNARSQRSRRSAAWFAAIVLLSLAGSGQAATVTYTQQQNQYDTRWDSGGGTYDTGSSTELGMWASGDQGYTVAWKTFRTGSATSSSARNLQVGDEFTIRVYTHGVYYGQIGVSLNRGGSTGNWANRLSGSQLSVRQDGGNYGSGGGIGSWYVIDNAAGESFTNTPAGASAADYTVKVKITSSSTYNVDLGGKTKYDRTMAGAPTTSQRIDAYSIFLNDDRRYIWSWGDNRKDSYWKQTTTVEDTGLLQFGGDGASRTINGLIANGLAADSTATVRTNRLIKLGAGTMTLGVSTNTYTGGSQVENGILQGAGDRYFGIAPGSPSTNHFDIWSTGTLQFTGSFTLDSNRGIALGIVATPKIGVTSGNSVNYGGSMVGTANWQKVGDGTLVLTGVSSNSGVAHVTAGLLVLGQDQAAGAPPASAGEKINVWSTGTLGFTNVFTLHANRSIELGATHGPRFWVAPASTATVSSAIQGSANWTNVGPGTLVLSNNTFSGSLTLTQGVVRLVHTNGLGAVAAGTVVASGAELQLSAPGNYPAEALTLNGTGVSGGGALRKVDTTGRNFAGNITLGANSKIAVDAGGLNPSGIINLAGYTLTLDTTASFQMLSGSTITNATAATAITKTGSSFFTLRPSSDMTGGIALDGGEIRIDANASGTGLIAGNTLTMASGTKLSAASSTARTVAKNVAINGNVGLAINSTGGLTLSGTVNLGGGTRILTNSNAVTISGVISNGGLTKTGAGAMTLSGQNTFASATTISAGTLIYNGTNTTSAVTVSSGATLLGVGSIGAATITGTVNPGAADDTVGSLRATAATLSEAGAYRWEITNVAGSPGSQWDVISVDAGGGTITVGSSSGTPFTIHVYGDPTGFSQYTAYSWTIADAGTLTDFAANKFSVNTDNFTPAFSGTWTVSDSSGDLKLNYTPDAPATPDNLAASDGTSTAHVALSWDDVTGESGFVIWRHTADAFGGATAIYTNAANTVTYNDGGASPGQLYYYWVTATNDGGSSAESDSDAGYRKLATVADVAATDGTHLDKVTVTWTDITGETSYGVWRHTADDSGAASFLASALANAESYDDTSASPGQTYYYWVRATNNTSASQGDFSDSDDGYRKLATVSDLAATDGTHLDKVALSWSDVTGETSYGIWRHTADDYGAASFLASAAANAESYDDESAAPGQQYYYWVRATNNTSASQGDAGDGDGGYRKLAEVGDLDATYDTHGDKIVVTWTDITGETSYGLWRHTADNSAAASFLASAAANAESYEDFSPDAGTEYYYWVRATNNTSASQNDFQAAGALGRRASLAPPVLINPTAASILTNGATLGAEISDDGGSAILSRGTVWDTSATPTANELSEGGTVTGVFSHARTGMTPGTLIHYRGWASNAQGKAYSADGSFWTVPSAPAPSAASALAVSSFSANWSASTGATNYLLDVSAADDFAAFVGGYEARLAGNVTTLSVTGLASGTTYYWRLRAQNSGGLSVYSTTNTALTVPAAPIATAATNWTTSTFWANWNAAVGASAYRLDVSTSATFSIVGASGAPYTVGFDGASETKASYAEGDVTLSGLSWKLTEALLGATASDRRTGDTGRAARVRSGFLSMNADTNMGLSSITFLHGIYGSDGISTGRVEYSTDGGGAWTTVGTFRVASDALTAYEATNLNVTGNVRIRILHDSAATNQRFNVDNIVLYPYGDQGDFVPGFENRAVSDTTEQATNLAAGTVFYYRARAQNASGVSTNSNVITAYTLSAEPTGHASDFDAAAATDTKIDLSWTAADGPPSGYLVLQRADEDPTGAPEDATGYVLGAAVGDGTVAAIVTTGAEEGTTVSNLSAGTTYHFAIFPFNWNGANAPTYNYRVAAAVPTANATTHAAEPSTQATTIEQDARTKSTMDVSWTAGNGAGRIVVAREGEAVDWLPADGTAPSGVDAHFPDADDQADGNRIVYNGAGESVTVTGLKTNTTYHFRVYEYNGSGGTINYNTNTASGNPASYATAADEPGIGRGPATLSPSTTVGSSPAAGAFYVTNIGGSALSYQLSSNASWLSISPNSAAGKTAGQATSHTVTYNAAGLGAGVSNATITITGTGAGENEATNSPQTVSVALTLNAIPDPSSQTATADGNEMVRLAWTPDGSYGTVLILHKTTGAITLDPTQGTSYAVGDVIDGATAIYKGTGTALEHVGPSGVTRYYKFYSINNNHYSPGATANAAVGSYGAGEIVEPFAYTNGLGLGSRNGGSGWTNAWATSAGTWTVITNVGIPTFQTMAYYPTNRGNRLKLSNPGNGGNGVAHRNFEAKSSGKVYAAALLSYSYHGYKKWAGLSFLNGAAETGFFGKAWSESTHETRLGIDSYGGAASYSTYDLNSIENNTGNVYLVIGRYDFSTRELSTKAYYRTDEVPDTEPGTWDATVTVPDSGISSINGVRISAGCSDGDNTVGDVYFDELRVAESWADLVQTAPNVEDPDAASASADGKEMIRLAWTKHASYNVMIVHNATNAPTAPTDTTAYDVGDSVGSDGSTVIYKGAGAALEHVVTPGIQHHYLFVSYNGNYYSDGLTANVTLGSYAAYEIVNPFSYTNDTSLGTSTRGGQGFGTHYWAASGSGTWGVKTNYAAADAGNVPRFVDIEGYPDMAGNLVRITGLADTQSGTAERNLGAAINSGQIYVAFMMAYQYYGSNKWAGVSLFNDATEKAFFGKGSGNNWHTLAIGDGSAAYWSAVDLLPFGGGAEAHTGNVYLVVGKYNFDNNLLQGHVWNLPTETFPDDEPVSWDVSQTLGTGIDSIDRVKLNVGANNGNIGNVYFDEIRIATNWTQLLGVVCPSWIGSNKLGNTWVYLGDSMNFECQTWPIGPGQSAAVGINHARDGSTWVETGLTWMRNENNNSYWSNRVQMVAAGSITSRFSATAGSCSTIYTNNDAVVVSNLPPPSAASATLDDVNTNSQINLAWTRNAPEHDVLVLRRTSDADWPTPTPGTIYNPGDSIDDATVVYRGSDESFEDTGLAPSTTYYYRFFSENWSYYSVEYAADDATTEGGTQTIVVDGNPADWIGSVGAPYNAGVVSVNEYIWRDKASDQRTDNANHANADVREFRVYATADDVYFLVKYGAVSADQHPYIAIGLDTRRSADSAGMNWLGDDSGLALGSDYFGGGAAAAHYPERNIIVHKAAGSARVELFAADGGSWYGPPSGWEAAISADHNAIEVRVPRADLLLTGTVTGRFTVASFLNTESWANEGDSTVQIVAGTPDAVDTLSIAPYQQNDGTLSLSAWQEEISDFDVDFWFDVRFNATGLAGHAAPSTPAIGYPTNDASVAASPTLRWNASTDSDGEVTGYFLEVSTNSQLNGASGTENGSILLRVNLPATQTNYSLSTSETQYYWRVRARDTAGALSGGAINRFVIGGKSDVEGPAPTLLYIGTNVAGYLNGDYDDHIARYGYIQSITDAEVKDQDNVVGYVVRWADPSGVYATNQQHAGGSEGAFTWNIVSTDGRVSPNWDIVEYTNGILSREWGIDVPFHASNIWAQGNTSLGYTAWVYNAFIITNYSEDIEYFLTMSAEDNCEEGGSWWGYGTWNSFGAASPPYWGGYALDGPNTARNVTTNYLIEIQVTDDDRLAPSYARGQSWDSEHSLLVSNATDLLDVSGTGLQAWYTATDGTLVGEPLTFFFNVYDFYSGVQVTSDGPATTNTTLSVGEASWLTNNYANYDATRSSVADTTSDETVLAWHFDELSFGDLTALWGGDGSGDAGVTNPVMLTLWDTDNDRANDQAVASNSVFGRLQVLDDDTAAPAPANIYSVSNLVETLRILHVTAGTSNCYLSGDTTSRIFRVTDGNLANLSSAYPLRLSIGANDASGVARGTYGSNWNMAVSLGAIVVSNQSAYSADESTPNPAAGISTNVWRFETMSYADIGALFTAGTNAVVVTVPDADMDRGNDQMVLHNQQYGYLAVRDDDVLGPALGGVELDGAPASGTEILGTGFETTEGWPTFQASGDLWTNVLTSGTGTGTWYGTGYVNIGDPRSGTRKGGFTTTGLGQYFELPPRDNPGILKVQARLSSAGANRHLAVERWNGTEWVGHGTNTITSDSYQEYSWEIDTIELSVTVRVVRVGADGSPGIYMDDLQLLSAEPLWLSTTAVTTRWNEAVDASGIHEYRVVSPSYTSAEPTAIDDGDSIGVVTSTVFDVTGFQGVLTGYVFAVDNDNDRANDRLQGNNSAFLVRIDTNPPPLIEDVEADEGDDPTSEALVSWTAAANAGERVEPSAAVLSPWATYRIYYTDDETEPTKASSYIDGSDDASLSNRTTASVVFSNLIFDTTYKFRITGIDQAGNEGPLSDTATIALPGFNVTQGLVRTVSGIPSSMLYWKAATNQDGGVSREYDLIWVDAQSFSDGLTNSWRLLASGWTNALPDTGSVSRTPPSLMLSTMRFYRAANKERWATNRAPRVASEEVYGLKGVRLYRRQNWVGLPVDPDSNTVKNILGIDLPGGASASHPNSTRVTWYQRVTNQLAEKQLWLANLGSSNQWRTGTGFETTNTPADHIPIEAYNGVAVVLPTNATPQTILIIGRVPTNVVAQRIEPKSYNMVTLHAPVRQRPRDMNLVESGFQGGTLSTDSDRLRRLVDPEGQATGPDIWYHSGNDQWLFTGSGGSAEGVYIEPGEGFLIYTRKSAEAWYWTNSLPYSPPTRTFNP